MYLAPMMRRVIEHVRQNKPPWVCTCESNQRRIRHFFIKTFSIKAICEVDKDIVFCHALAYKCLSVICHNDVQTVRRVGIAFNAAPPNAVDQKYMIATAVN